MIRRAAASPMLSKAKNALFLRPFTESRCGIGHNLESLLATNPLKNNVRMYSGTLALSMRYISNYR
jgi:hypothetical protein